MPLEHGRYAVRRDLAEIEVADRVFAQHYVKPIRARLNALSNVYARPAADSEVVASLANGDIFYLVDLGHEWAWGRGQTLNSTGYVPATALDLL